MTAQTSNKVIFNCHRYSLAGECGTTRIENTANTEPPEFESEPPGCDPDEFCQWLLEKTMNNPRSPLAGLKFNPRWYGVKLGRDRMSTGCYHGYVCTYEINNEKLFLKDLQTIATPEGNLNGVTVSFEGVPDFPEFYYRSVDIPILFSGGIIIADDFIGELYSHMGFHPAWKYRHIIELIFDDGELIESRDVSDKADEYRKKFVNKNEEPKLEELTKEELIRRYDNDDLYREDYVDTGSTEKWIEETFTLQYKM